MTRRAFTLVELLVCMGVIALLTALLLPGLAGARESARTSVCRSGLRQLGIAWALYAGDYADRAMPLAYWSAEDIGSGEQVFWWGTHGTSATPVDHSRGFISPYLDAPLGVRSIFECPAQPWGTYRAQGPSREPTSTYGYNGYYLSPAKTPGWGATIGFRPWRRLFEIRQPSTLLVFSDSMLPTNPERNSALLDPPCLFFDGAGWQTNNSPTTSFRHETRGITGLNASVCADGSTRATASEPGWLVNNLHHIGSIGLENAPWYVPDSNEWK